MQVSVMRPSKHHGEFFVQKCRAHGVLFMTAMKRMRKGVKASKFELMKDGFGKPILIELTLIRKASMKSPSQENLHRMLTFLLCHSIQLYINSYFQIKRKFSWGR
mmetsp:Transcript_3628/g.8657  ORF Transcript_3628/g.8657 Transcript_3628/m.8657 type:complete len:105 (-) Transcript_3628:1056-1370(-)